MSYQRIRYFLQAAKEGSFSKAAQHMYISSQALTKQIALLEKDFGAELFSRTAKGIELTEFGSYSYERLEKLDREYEFTINDLKTRAREKKKKLNIGIFAALPQENLVSPLISHMLASYPDYEISLNLVDLLEGRMLLLQGDLDLLLTNTHEEDDWEDCSLLSFGCHELKVVVSMRHPWAIKDTLTIEDLKGETFLKMDMGETHYKVPKEQTFYENVACRNVKLLSNFSTMMALLQQGTGFAIFPQVFAHMDSAHVKCFDYPGKSVMFHTAIVYHPGNAKKEINLIAERIAEEFDLEKL